MSNCTRIMCRGYKINLYPNDTPGIHRQHTRKQSLLYFVLCLIRKFLRFSDYQEQSINDASQYMQCPRLDNTFLLAQKLPYLLWEYSSVIRRNDRTLQKYEYFSNKTNNKSKIGLRFSTFLQFCERFMLYLSQIPVSSNLSLSHTPLNNVRYIAFSMRTNSILTPCEQGAVLSRYSFSLLSFFRCPFAVFQA